MKEKRGVVSSVVMFHFRLRLLKLTGNSQSISTRLYRRFTLDSRSVNQLPVIDASNLEHCKTTRTEIAAACSVFGAFYLKHHRVDSKRLLTELAGFFGSSDDAIKESAKPKEGIFGYFSVGEEMTLGIQDWKEGMYYRAEYTDQGKTKPDSILYANNYWPDSKDFPTFKHTVHNYLGDIKNLGFQLTTCIADDLGLKRTFFTDRLTDKPFQHIGMFRYPKCSEDSLSSPFAVGVHSDPGFFSVILQDDVGGLEIKSKTGQWISVPSIPDTLVVLMCDLAEVWTNGYCHSVIHRVQKPFKKDRYSVVVFFDPSLDCTIVPGEAKGNSNCEVAPRLTELDRGPFGFHDYCVKFYEKILSKNTPV